jgi:hypothetical protein
MEDEMDFPTAIKIANDPRFNSEAQLDDAFEKLVLYRDMAQEGISAINRERARRTEEEVKRLRAEIAAKA